SIASIFFRRLGSMEELVSYDAPSYVSSWEVAAGLTIFAWMCRRVTGCAVKRRWSTAGVTRPGTGSLHPVAIRAAMEATRLLKPQSLDRVRERWVMRRTAVINQIRGLLLERGITLRKGRCHVGEALRMLLAQLKLELDHLD